MQVTSKCLKGKNVIGVAAGRFHTVLWTRDAFYTVGLNGGQLGRKQMRGNDTVIVYLDDVRPWQDSECLVFATHSVYFSVICQQFVKQCYKSS